MTNLPTLRALRELEREDSERARALLVDTSRHDGCSGDYRDELLTVLAKTYASPGSAHEGMVILRQLRERVNRLSPRSRACLALEDARLKNAASYASADAKRGFEEAFELARSGRFDDLALDAAHMLSGVVFDDEEAQLRWSMEAVRLAEVSRMPDAHARLGAMYHDAAWAHHEWERYDEALALFEKALRVRESRGDDPEAIFIARWSVAMMWRELGRPEQALEAQLDLASQRDLPDAHNLGEIARCLIALGRQQEAHAYIDAAVHALRSVEPVDEFELEELESLR